MKQRNRPTGVVLTAALLALAVAAPAPADWLITRQGGRVETKGPWQVKGKLVVFTLPDGKLSSLRASEIDLDASRNATEEAVAAAAVPPPAPVPVKPREAKVVLTDKDFRQAPPPAPAPKPEEGAAAPEAEEAKLSVASWERIQDPGDGHVVITGAVHNEAPNDATSVMVTVLLYDETGKLLVTSDATLSSTILPAGQSGTFRADFPDVFSFAATKFETRGLHVLREAGEPSKSADGN